MLVHANWCVAETDIRMLCGTLGSFNLKKLQSISMLLIERRI